MAAGEGADTLLFIVGKPVIARHPGIVFINFAEAADPVVVLTGTDADPVQETRDRDVGLVGPGADEIDKLVARVVGNPANL